MSNASTPRASVTIFTKPSLSDIGACRLAQALGQETAARLAVAFLHDTVATVSQIPDISLNLGIRQPWQVYAEASSDLAAATEDVPKWHQGDGDLGVRLERALRRGLRQSDRAVVVAGDSPGLPTPQIEAALNSLDEADCVFGPALDGGFYLIGMRRCPEGCLRDLPWSTSKTLEACLGRMFELGLSPTVAPSFFDVDSEQDLHTFSEGVAAGLWRATHTERVLSAVAAELKRSTLPDVVGA
ncbi:MAG: glycosyltransferase [Myxococcales bacterium]|nr:glycosyltransferase [Myxococcales bacterium]